MRTVIYLDILLVDNAVLASILLGACSFLCGASYRGIRAIMASAAAALFSLAILLPAQPLWLQLLYQIMSAFCVVRIAFAWRGWRVILRQLLCYFLLNMLLSGAVVLACIKKAGWVESNNMISYFQLSPLVLFGSAAGIYLLLRLAICAFGAVGVAPQPVCLQGEGWSQHLMGFYDTGLQLVDPLTHKPVLVVSYPAAASGLPQVIQNAIQRFFTDGDGAALQGLKIFCVPCHTVAGETLLPAVPVCVQIQGKSGVQALAAFTMERYDRRYEVLYGPALGFEAYRREPEKCML